MTDMIDRRMVTAGVLLAGAAAAQTAPWAPPLAETIPLRIPRAELIYEAVVDIAPTQEMGQGPLGARRIVPITGGHFVGPRIRGRVLPGGADRQLLRPDGVRMLDALYEMQADDGAIITVHNQVLIDANAQYRLSHIALTAPDGPHAWMNRLVVVGTLDSLRPAREAVCIRAFAVLQG